MPFLRRFWPVLLLALVPVLPLWRAVFLGEAIGPFDQIAQMAPWNAAKPAQPWDVLQADGVLEFYPWRSMVFESWGKGQLPAWNPYELAGTPLLANSQSAALYPPHILMGVLHVPVVPAMTLLAWFHLFWAGLGLYCLVRRLGGTSVGGVVAGTSFALSTFMLAWTTLPSVISTVAWIPWVLWGVASQFGGSWPNPRGVAFLAVSIGMMLLAGHLQFAAYGMMAGAVLAIWFAVRPPEAGTKANWRALVRCAVAVALGVLLAAPQLLPVLGYGKFSHRQNTPTEADYVAYSGLALPPAEVLARSANPMAEGDPTEFDADHAGSTFWPATAKPGANFAESAGTVGPLVLILSFIAILCGVRMRAVAPLLAVSVLGLLIACGSWFNRLLYFGVPGWSSTGSPNRAIVLFVMALCAIAGLGASESVSQGKKKLVGLALILVALCIAGGSINAGGVDPKFAQMANLALSSSLVPLLVALALTSIVIGMSMFSETGRLKPFLAAAPLAIAAILYAPHLVRTSVPLPPTTLLDAAPNERIAAVNKGWDFVLAAPALLPPNTASISKIHELGGYDSLIHKSTVDMLKSVNGPDPQGRDPIGLDPAAEANGNMMFIKPAVDAAKLADAGVSLVIATHPLKQLGDPKGANGFFEFKIPGPGRAYTPAGPAKIISESYSDIVLTAEGPGTLNLKDRNMPGWEVTVDGREAPIGGDVWREVELTSGKHTMRFSYTPPGFILGLELGIPAFVMTAIIAFGGRRTGEKPGLVAQKGEVA